MRFTIRIFASFALSLVAAPAIAGACDVQTFSAPAFAPADCYGGVQQQVLAAPMTGYSVPQQQVIVQRQAAPVYAAPQQQIILRQAAPVVGYGVAGRGLRQRAVMGAAPLVTRSRQVQVFRQGTRRGLFGRIR